jgi:uncharacterized protein (TIGR00255 family)
MALISMTGYGNGAASKSGVAIEVELSSVTRRQFDARVSLPRALFALEPRVQELLRKSISRGYVSVAVKLGAGKGQKGSATVDLEAAEACIRDLRKTAKKLGLADDLTANTLVELSGLVKAKGAADDPKKIWPLIEIALKQALARLGRMRKAEGKALQKDIMVRFTRLQKRVVSIRGLAPRVQKRYRQALVSRLKKAGVELRQADERLLRELVLFADRSDISEETVRLESHFKQVAKLVSSKEPSGRPLDFLCQEMFREINTIGSKANDASISRHVVRFKTELEAVREQVQNIE